MAREKKIEKDCCALAEADGWKQRKVTSPGRRAAFDRIFIKEGRTVWIEFKDPDEGEVSPLQWVEYKDLIEHGAEAYFCDNETEFRAILDLPAC